MPVRSHNGFTSSVLFLLVLVVLLGAAGVQASGEPVRVKKKAKAKVVKLVPIGDSVESDTVVPVIPRNMPPVGTDGQQKNDWFYKKRAFPDTYIDPEAFRIARQQAKAMPHYSSGSKNARSTAIPQWQQIGPFDIGGRITAIATHPSNADIFYVGAASGGVWKTTDKGQTFTSLTDTFSSQPVGALRIDPRSPETIYMGQGECNFSADSWPGDGLWRSENGGATWQYLGLARTQYIAKILIDPRTSNTLYVAAPGPTSLNDTNRGVYKSTDRGATWTSVLRPRAGSIRIPIIDLAMNPVNPDELVAAAWDRTGNEGIAGPNTGLWHTTNAGATWARIDTLGLGYPDGRHYNFNRTVLYWAATSQGPALYAAISRNDSNELTKRNSYANLHGLYRSFSPGEGWEKLQDSTLRIHYGGLNFDSVNVLHRQGYYNFYLEGNPKNGDELYLGGIDVLRSTDLGRTFTNITRSYGSYYFKNDRGQHPDQHHLAFTADPSGTELVVGSDGGVFRTRDFGATWSQYGGLPITMFYSLTPWFGGMKHLSDKIIADSLKIFGGTQDNGTVAKGLTASSDYDMINNADGGVAWAHPTDPEKILVSKQQGRIFLRVGLDSLVPSIGYDGPATDPGVYQKQWHNLTRNLITGQDRLTDTTEPVGFIAPYAVDPNDLTKLYFGRMRLYRATIDYTQPEKTKWQTWSPYLVGDTSNAKRWTGYTVEAIGVGPHDEAGNPLLWVGGVMLTSSGSSLSVHRTTVDAALANDAAPRWISAKTGLPLAIPTTIVADPIDSLTAFIAFSRYSKNSIYKTTDGGKKWTSIGGNLPAVPVTALAFDRDAEGGDVTKRNQFIFAATDVGVFMTRNGGVEWTQVGEGLPVVVVGDIKIYKNLLIAGTHGRSAWSIDLDEVRNTLDVAAKPVAHELAVYPNPVQLNAGRAIRFLLDAEIEYARLVNVTTGADVKYRTESMGSNYELSLPEQISAGSYLLQVLTRSGDLFQSKVSIY
ncbi:MAG TPA: hypothetical protein VFH43_09055 [Candidatus Kapabacteria bacterium]|nr:hypothetical protein [Candidatus Kapabacteria bacterium]